MKNNFSYYIKKTLINKNLYNYRTILVEVIDIKKNFIIVNSNLKSESFIPINEFKEDDNKIYIKIGDIIPVFIINIENGLGNTILSYIIPKKLKSWYSLEIAFENNHNVIGYVIKKNKGGLSILCNGIKAFLPKSLIGIKKIKNINLLKNKFLSFKVIKIDRKRNNIILSRKAFFKNNFYKIKKFILNIKKNSIVIGIVKNITSYGVFINLGYIDGLIHISDLSWEKIKHPSNILKLGDRIKVKILNYNIYKKRISLGLKQLKKKPWSIVSKIYINSLYMSACVINYCKYGLLVKIQKDFFGLIHISQINWYNKKKYLNINKLFYKNQIILVNILNYNKIKNRLNLSLKYFYPNPNISIIFKYKYNSYIKGFIFLKKKFGVIIKLYNEIIGISGLYKNNINKKNIFKKKLFNYYICSLKKNIIILRTKKIFINKFFKKFILINKINFLIKNINFIKKINKNKYLFYIKYKKNIIKLILFNKKYNIKNKYIIIGYNLSYKIIYINIL